MPDLKTFFQVITGSPARWLTLALLLHAAIFYSLSLGESIPLAQPLSEFPKRVGDWSLSTEGVVEDAVQKILKADDLLNRSYTSSALAGEVNLFIAFFRSQRAGQAPHSPKNCLPGSGWVPNDSRTVSLIVPGESEPVTVNRYLVAKGEYKSLVYYWYQSNRRVIASEYDAKFFLVLDAIRYNRTDTSLVRVLSPVISANEKAAENRVESFIRAIFPSLRNSLPNLPTVAGS